MVEHHDAPDRIVAALHGALVVVPSIAGTKWSPAKLFSKRNGGVDLFERAVTANGKVPARGPSSVGQILAAASRISAAGPVPSVGAGT